jgi:hypothetical protein
MRGEQVHLISSRLVTALSLLALLTVLSGYLQPPHTQTGRGDEGTAAHIFQISIVLTALTILLYIATADWTRPLQSARPLALPAAFLVAAFTALYYLEHYYLPR